MKRMNSMTDEELFNEWYDRFGCRYFSSKHGTADGHREYLYIAFMSGFNAAKKEEHEPSQD